MPAAGASKRRRVSTVSSISVGLVMCLDSQVVVLDHLLDQDVSRSSGPAIDLAEIIMIHSLLTKGRKRERDGTIIEAPFLVSWFGVG